MTDTVRDGKSLYLEFGGVVLDGSFRDFDPGVQEVSVDATSGSDELTSTHKIRETVAPTLSILVKAGATGDAIKAALAHGARANLIWGLDGNGTGEAKSGIEARVISNIPMGHGGEQIMDVAFENEGTNWLFDGRSDTF